MGIQYPEELLCLSCVLDTYALRDSAHIADNLAGPNSAAGRCNDPAFLSGENRMLRAKMPALSLLSSSVYKDEHFLPNKATEALF